MDERNLPPNETSTTDPDVDRQTRIIIPQEDYRPEEPFVRGDVELPTVVPRPKPRKKSGWARVWQIQRSVLKWIFAIAAAAAILVAGLIGYLSVTEYQPAHAEAAERGAENITRMAGTQVLTAITYNTGSGISGRDAAGANEALTRSALEGNMLGIEWALEDYDPDFVLLQEVDTDAKRSHNYNQWLQYEYDLGVYETRFALNHSCNYVPLPLGEALGKVQSGLASYSRFDITSATRYSLPRAYHWPARVYEPQQCLLVARIELDGREEELVLINFQLAPDATDEAYEAQFRELIRLMQREAMYGNYVIAGGDFGRTFARALRRYPVAEGSWEPATLASLPSGLKYYYDPTTPTARELSGAYDPQATQHYILDGYIVSENVSVLSVQTLDEGFAWSDHNPVLLEFLLN